MTPVERLTLTVSEAARLLGIGRALCYELARQGKLPALRLGRRLVIPREALVRMLASDLGTPSDQLAGLTKQAPGQAHQPTREKGCKDEQLP